MRQDGPLRINLIAVENLLDQFRIERAVLFGKRVNGGVEKVLRDRELARKFGRREHGRVIAGNEFLQKVPDLAVRMRQINVAPPNPVIGTGRPSVNQRDRLWVMNDHEFGIERKVGAIPLVVGEKNLKILGLVEIRLAVQGIVERFRDVEKFFRAFHHVPTHGQLEFFGQRYQTVENFRNAASHSRGVDHLHAAAAQGLGQRAQFLDLALSASVRRPRLPESQ